MVTNLYREDDGSVTYEFRGDDGSKPVTDRVTLNQKGDQTQVGFLETAAERIRKLEYAGHAPRVVEVGFQKNGSLFMTVEIQAHDPS